MVLEPFPGAFPKWFLEPFPQMVPGAFPLDQIPTNTDYQSQILHEDAYSIFDSIPVSSVTSLRQLLMTRLIFLTIILLF